MTKFIYHTGGLLSIYKFYHIYDDHQLFSIFYTMERKYFLFQKNAKNQII